MSRLLNLIDDIKQKIPDNHYKLILEEIAEERKTKLSLSKIKISIPFIKLNKDNDDCADCCYDIFQEIFIFILPTEFVVKQELSPGNIVSPLEIYEASLEHEETFLSNQVLEQALTHDHVHIKSCVIISIEQVNP